MKLDDPNALSKLPVQIPIALVQARLKGDDKPDPEPKKEEKKENKNSDDKDDKESDDSDKEEKKKEPSKKQGAGTKLKSADDAVIDKKAKEDKPLKITKDASDIVKNSKLVRKPKGS